MFALGMTLARPVGLARARHDAARPVGLAWIRHDPNAACNDYEPTSAVAAALRSCVRPNIALHLGKGNTPARRAESRHRGLQVGAPHGTRSPGLQKRVARTGMKPMGAYSPAWREEHVVLPISGKFHFLFLVRKC